DIGNIDIESSTVRETQQEIADVTNALHASSAFPILVGGDNSVTVGNVEPLLSRGSVGAISLDAHLDCREVQDQPSSGTPYRQLFESGLESLVVVGARHFETSTIYHDYLRSQNGEIITAEEIGEDVVSSANQAIDALGDVDFVYISLDMDVLDMSAAPGVSAPTPGGILSRELFRLLRLLSTESRICGFEIVECAPPLDDANKTVTTAARAIAHFISGYTNQ
ncbi:MAG: arginase family protein, partial [Halobacteriaceae archaeon]